MLAETKNGTITTGPPDDLFLGSQVRQG